MKKIWYALKNWFKDDANIVLACVLFGELLLLGTLVLRTISVTFFVM